MLLTEVLEGVIEPVADLVSNDPADADPAGLRQPFEPRRHVHPIAEDVLPLGNHIAEVDPDPELDPLVRWGARVALGHPALHVHGAADGINDTRELSQEAVAGVLHHPAPMLCDLRVDELPEMPLEPFVRPLLIRPHQARVARHVGGEDRSEAADRGHGLSGGRLS